MPHKKGDQSLVAEEQGGPSAGESLPTSGVRRTYTVEQAYRDHFDFVWRNVKRRGVNEAAIDDVVQEVFLVVHRRLASFEGRSSLRSWIYAIMRRVVKDHFRAAHQRVRKNYIDEYDETTRGDSQAPDGESALARREGSTVLHQLLEKLSEKKREAFILAELEDMSITEIAETLGENFNTVYSRVRSARRDFEKAVEQYHAEEEARRQACRTT